jgi:signal transduction histidine kinase
MNPDAKPQPQRDKTDESLRAERENTDQVIATRGQAEERSDAIVERARERADAVLDIARDHADEGRDSTPIAGPGAIARERALADEILKNERAHADERLRRERVEDARVLAALLPLEREATDRYLFTERAHSDSALAQRDDFLGMASHDLRNLLSGIAMSATLFTERYPDAQEGPRIQRYVARMNRLIGDLVDIVSIDAGRLTVRRERSDAVALIAEAVDAFSHRAAEKRVSLESETAGHDLVGDFDHERMMQVLANLVTNAIKFTHSGGHVVVRGERIGSDLQISVRDDGEGIPEDMLDAVFERFWQVGKNDKRGLGLGLYISRCIVAAHGGTIWVESEPGVGSTFRFTIPNL